MPDPLQSQSVRPVEEYPYIPLMTWFEDQDVMKKYFRGEAYVASHVWDLQGHKVETFGRSVLGDEAQKKLSEFLNRRPGSWSDTPETRRARWIGHVKTDGARSPYIETVLRHLKLRYAVFDEPHADPETMPRKLDLYSGRSGAIFVEQRGPNGIVDHGHLTHFTFDAVPTGKAHVFLLNSNDIVTIYDGVDLKFPMRLHGSPPFVPLQGKVNAAAVLWRILTLSVEAAGTSSLADRQPLPYNGGSLDSDRVLAMRHARPWHDAGPMLLDSICDRLVDRQGRSRSWMEDDIAADFQQLSQYCKRMLRNQADYYRSLDHVVEIKESRRRRDVIDIAEKQAHSAVVLNRLLAIFTACTLVCVPFIMTAAFFSMNTSQDVPLSIQRFWTIVGSATGAVTAAGLVIAFLFRYWREIIQHVQKVSDSRREKRDQRSVDKIFHHTPSSTNWSLPVINHPPPNTDRPVPDSIQSHVSSPVSAQGVPSPPPIGSRPSSFV